MQALNLLPLVTTFALVTAPFATAQQQVLATETFDYPAGNIGNQNGGTGWTAEWWAGNTEDASICIVPGFDSVGGMQRTNLEHSGSYRALDLDQFAWLKDPVTGVFGKEGTTIWISFDCQRTPGGDDFYGGLHLNRQWIGHQLFIGSNWGGTAWGFEKNFVGAPVEAPNTNCDVRARLVVRIDFEAGDDFVSLWVDPTEEYPTTTPNAFSYMPDIHFNEIYIQSGDGLVTGFDFDNIIIATEADGPRITAENFISGRYTTLKAFNCVPGHRVFFAYSVFGGGPTSSTYGNILLSQPWGILPVTVADANGIATLLEYIPLGFRNLPVWLQALDLTPGPGGAGVLSDGLNVVIQ